MELLFVFLVAFLLAGLVNIVSPNPSEEATRNAVMPCYEKNEPHDWTYNKDDKLQCTVCNYVAGD
jgi:hypothetical protein